MFINFKKETIRKSNGEVITKQEVSIPVFKYSFISVLIGVWSFLTKINAFHWF